MGTVLVRVPPISSQLFKPKYYRLASMTDHYQITYSASAMTDLRAFHRQPEFTQDSELRTDAFNSLNGKRNDVIFLKLYAPCISQR